MQENINNQPHHNYFRNTHGHWQGPFVFELLDRNGLMKSAMSLIDRLQLLAFFLLFKLPGPAQILTQMDYHSLGPTQNVVKHTTEVKKWGWSLMRSKEEFYLKPDGVSVAVTVKQYTWPYLASGRSFGKSHCVVNANAIQAKYTFDWFGTPLIQTTYIEMGLGDIAGDITMDVGWAKGTQKLTRMKKND